MIKPADLGRLIKDSALAYWSSQPSRLAAAISFYAAFSLAPLTILAVMVTSCYARDFDAYFSMALRDLMGQQNATTILGLVSLLGEGSWNLPATTVGSLSVAFGATGVFVEIQAALNTIWSAPVRPEGSVWGFLRQRLLTFLMLLGTGILLVLSTLAFAALTTLNTFFQGRIPLPLPLLVGGHGLVLFFLLTLLFAKAYKLLPDVELHWRDVLLGGAVTSLFFTAGKALMGWYLGRFGLAGVYGPAATPMALLFWLYYSSHIFLFGAHFTYVYARRYGSLAPLPGSGLEPRAATPKVRRKKKRAR